MHLLHLGIYSDFTAQMNCGPDFQLIMIQRAICIHYTITKAVGFKTF